MKRFKWHLLFAGAITALFVQHRSFADDVTVTNQEQRITTTQYDYDSRATYDIDAPGGVTRYTYDAQTSTTDSSHTTTEYDAQDRLNEPTPGNPSTYTYDAQDRVTQGSTTDAPADDTSSNDTYTSPDIGGSIQYQYDSQGRDTIQETDPAGRTSHYQYDTQQGVTESDGGDPLGNTTHYQYDSLNRTIESSGSLNADTTNTEATGTTDFGNITRTQYDELGSITLEPGTASAITYDLDLQLIDTTGGGNTTIFKYDHDGATLNSGSPSYFISDTLIPLEGLNGSLTPGDTYEFKYTLDVTGTGKVNYDFNLTVPATPAWLGGGALLAMMGVWSASQATLRARTCRK